MQEMKKAALPPALAKLPLEDLQQFTLETLKKLKARDKKIAELSGALEKADAAADAGPGAHAGKDSGEYEALERQLEVRASSARLVMCQVARLVGLRRAGHGAFVW